MSELNSKQIGLFEPSTVGEAPDIDLSYIKTAFSKEHADRLFDELLTQTNWQQDKIKIYGKTHLTPRLSLWVADDSLSYGYSNMRMQVHPWSSALLECKAMVEKLTNCSFNSVLLNYYRDGKDSNGWHSDNEPELGPKPVIASLSLGAERDFKLRHKYMKQHKLDITLEHGSLLVMAGDAQEKWQHCIPKRANAKARINLTFRYVYPNNESIY